MYTLIIPCAGSSTRFPNMRPKWMLTLPDGKLMVEKAIEGLNSKTFDRIIITILREHVEKYESDLWLKQIFENQVEVCIVEDSTFVGAMCEVTEGCIIGEGSVLASGITISASTKIVERSSGKIMYGKIPPYSVCVAGTLPDKKNPLSPSLACVVIIKTTTEQTRKKTSLNELLRD